jgi:dihydrodipicolinate synthase/N-acetylneuraminate lyase
VKAHPRQDLDKPYRGVVVPMVTPVTSEGDLDEPAARRVIDHLIDGGVHGIFVLGTTGEASSVPPNMCSRLIVATVDQVGDRAKTYAGIGDTCFSRSVEAACEYIGLGIDVVVAHLPSYYALTPQQQLEWYSSLAREVPGPLMLYNMPSTTHMSIPIDIIEQLADHVNIIGLKDSENDFDRFTEVMSRLGGRSDFSIFVGVSSLASKAMALGVDGFVPSPGNLVPEACYSVYERAIAGDLAGTEVHQREMDIVADICNRDRPVLGERLAALKAAMGARSLCGPDMLPPLTTLTTSDQKALQNEILHIHASIN